MCFSSQIGGSVVLRFSDQPVRCRDGCSFSAQTRSYRCVSRHKHCSMCYLMQVNLNENSFIIIPNKRLCFAATRSHWPLCRRILIGWLSSAGKCSANKIKRSLWISSGPAWTPRPLSSMPRSLDFYE